MSDLVVAVEERGMREMSIRLERNSVRMVFMSRMVDAEMKFCSMLGGLFSKEKRLRRYLFAECAYCML